MDPRDYGYDDECDDGSPWGALVSPYGRND
jgi:hypothetical protein